MFSRLLFAFLLFLSFGVTAAQEATPPAVADWPTEGWRTASPAEQGMDADMLAGIPAFLDENHMYATYSIIVVRGGSIVYEAYFNGFRPTYTDNMRSVTKSVTATLVGIAIARGDLPGVDLKMADVFPEYFADGANADKVDLSLRDLLGMRSGLDWDDGDALSLENSGDQMKRVLSLPLAHPPGTFWNYSTADSHLISGMFQKTTGYSLEEYGDQYLFAPLGMTPGIWNADSQGYNQGGMGLALSPRDMAKFGYLYLHNGVWEDEQLVPAEWVEWTTSAQDGKDDYGYQWWRLIDGETEEYYPAFAARGYAGDNIFVLPELDMVVVTKTQWYVTGEVADQQGNVMSRMLFDVILPAVKDT
jgi:CubicO group peptidase (beta-lactamase class C family)